MKNTVQDFLNAGYSKERATKLASDPMFNWKASNGGKRKPVDFRKLADFTKGVKPGVFLKPTESKGSK